MKGHADRGGPFWGHRRNGRSKVWSDGEEVVPRVTPGFQPFCSRAGRPWLRRVTQVHSEFQLQEGLVAYGILGPLALGPWLLRLEEVVGGHGWWLVRVAGCSLRCRRCISHFVFVGRCAQC